MKLSSDEDIPEEHEGADGYYIDARQQDSPVTYIWHDYGENAKELIANSPRVAPTLSSFISWFKPHEDIETWEKRTGISISKE